MYIQLNIHDYEIHIYLRIFQNLNTLSIVYGNNMQSMLFECNAFSWLKGTF